MKEKGSIYLTALKEGLTVEEYESSIFSIAADFELPEIWAAAMFEVSLIRLRSEFYNILQKDGIK